MLETTDKIGLNGIAFETDEICDIQEMLKHDTVTNFSLAKAECELISRALQQTGWQKTRAAALLGITRATLYAKVKQYNIEKESLNPSNNDTKEHNKIESLSFV
jgi:DNA-binding NtrC family response regulator